MRRMGKKEAKLKAESLEKEIKTFIIEFRKLPYNEIDFIEDETIKKFYFELKHDLFGIEIEILTNEEIETRVREMIKHISKESIEAMHDIEIEKSNQEYTIATPKHNEWTSDLDDVSDLYDIWENIMEHIE